MAVRPIVALLGAAALIVACPAPAEEESAANTPTTTQTPTQITVPVEEPAFPVAAPVRHPVSARTIYFVMPDRFANGDPTNDRGGVEGGPLQTGFLPEDTGYHHGGDLAGLTEKLGYLKDLGVGALWLTPPFTNRFVQGDGTIDGSSSSYHGYWQTDWDRIDPHLGTEAEMRALVRAANEAGMLVFFDAVVNHTGDLIRYEAGSAGTDSGVYWSTSASPYLSAAGAEFDPAALAGSTAFPELDPATSFPYRPVFTTQADATAKSPAWLNDVTLYHNRGNSNFRGESSTYGDFFGLDDLFTEHPTVVTGMTDLYSEIIGRYNIDGYRIDTMKHVNLEFWETFALEVKAAAEAEGKPDFFFYGEVFNTDPISQSAYTNIGVPATLDFIVDAALQRYASGQGSGEELATAFDDDDWFTDADNNASMQVTFLGNHDEGRFGRFVSDANRGASDETLLGRMKLGYSLLFAIRGVPVVYYGDEQGFTGDGGDQAARQDMFASLTPRYLDDDNIGSDQTPADDNFDQDHPLYRHIGERAALRAEHRALSAGAQIVHDVPGPLFAFSRFDRDERVEYLVIANTNASLAVPARFTALTPGAEFAPIVGDGPRLRSSAVGEIRVEVPPLSVLVMRADAPLAIPEQPPAIEIVRPKPNLVIPTERYRLQAELDPGFAGYAEVTFAIREVGDDGAGLVVGVDDAPPYRVYWSNAHLPAGTAVEVLATASVGGSVRSDAAMVTATVRGDLRDE